MNPLVDTLPAMLRILLVFLLILLVIKRKWDLGHAFVLGALSLGVVFAMEPLSIATSALASMLHPKTLSLTIIVSLILVLSHSLEKTGQMARMLEAYKGLVHWPKLNLVVFPALIGLLPMPGGAIFSAPMVKTIGQTHRLSPATLSYINYWYRHIWEYWWPLYPGILLTTALADIDLWHLVFFTLPITGLAIAAGYWPLRGTIFTVDDGRRRAMGPFIKELAPILIVIVGGLGLGEILFAVLPPGIRSLAKEGGLIAALCVGIGWVWHMNHMPAKEAMGHRDPAGGAQNDLSGDGHPHFQRDSGRQWGGAAGESGNPALADSSDGGSRHPAVYRGCRGRHHHRFCGHDVSHPYYADPHPGPEPSDCCRTWHWPWSVASPGCFYRRCTYACCCPTLILRPPSCRSTAKWWYPCWRCWPVAVSILVYCGFTCPDRPTDHHHFLPNTFLY